VLLGGLAGGGAVAPATTLIRPAEEDLFR